ncbi:MAG: TCR/Tet family MFS transporter, partial [Pseudomonadota bacterium]
MTKSDAEEAPPKKGVLPFILIVLFLDAMGAGLILPVVPGLIKELTNMENAGAAAVAGYLLFTFAGVQFVFAPVLGALSDRYGRRPVLLLALFGFSIDYFLAAFAPTLIWLFVARAFSGLFGATFPAANAVIVDTTSQEERAKQFGLTGAAVGLGFVFGPAVGGLVGEYGTRYPFVLAGVLTMATAVYGYFAFPETLPLEKRRAFSVARANPIGGLLSVSGLPIVPIILFSIFLMMVASQSYVSVWAFYTNEVAGWTPQQVGLSAGFYGLLMAVFQGGLTGVAVKRFGEVPAATFSLIAALISYFGLALAGDGATIYAFILVGALAGFAFPAMQAMMTARTPDDAQGELQGAIASLFSIASITG